MSWSRCLRPSARQVLAVMVFWGQIQNYMMRVNLSILIVAMVKDPVPGATNATSITSDNSTDLAESDICPVDPATLSVFNASKIPAHQEHSDEVLFEWDAMTRGVILSAFSYGYVTTQIIGGRLTEMYGVKRVYGFCLLATAVLTLLSPVAAKLHVAVFIGVRVLQGVFEGVTFPALQAMTARWIPLEERTSFIARSFFGTTFGLIFTFPMCGALVVTAGWESAFYVIGCITFVWFIFWWFLVYDSPEVHPRISQSEKDLIEASIAANVDMSKTYPVPWKKIFTSVPFLGLLATDMGNSWGIIGLGSNGPTYLKYMLGVDIKTNGMLSGLPMMSRYFGGIFHSMIADWLQRRNVLTVVWTRRIFNSISQFTPAVAMLMLVFAPSVLQCNVGYAITLLCIGMFFNGALSCGHFSSYVDLSPNFAGTTMGIVNTFGSVLGFVVPLLIGAITNDNMTFSAWKLVFGLAATMYCLGNLIYIFTIKGHPQKWNFPEVVEEDKNETDEKLILAPKAEHEETDKL